MIKPYSTSSRPLLRVALLLLVIGLLASSQLGLAAPQFPTLTGRVVDDAGLLSASERSRLTGLLEAHESETTNQVVVVTLESLQGYVIEDFGYQLGRHWGIGQKGKDNGVLLIVAPNERKVRIEVGYGLEGTLTDALSRDIIETRILPAFKKGNYEAGIGRGTEAILAVLGGTYEPAERKPKATKPPSAKGQGENPWGVIFYLLFFGLWGFGALFGRGNSSSSGGGGGFSGGGGGFSGGGGGFGGGGASGGW